MNGLQAIRDLQMCEPINLAERFGDLRAYSESLTQNLSAEDCQVQSMEEASPAKWHLAHTTWFWETFFLRRFAAGYSVFDDVFDFLFNSYYEAVGPRHTRSRRGLITRPSLQKVMDYRSYVTDAMTEYLLSHDELSVEQNTVLQTGFAHEEQHHELLLTDIKHALFQNPLQPPLFESPSRLYLASNRHDGWSEYEEGKVAIGHKGTSFAYDNEGPEHFVWLGNYQLSDSLVTNGDVEAFLNDGGYRSASLWLSEGWDQIQTTGQRAPLYWDDRDDVWQNFTLHGRTEIDRLAPAAHLTFFEANAIALWSGARLPTEFEWEHAARLTSPSPSKLRRKPDEPCSPEGQASGSMNDLFGQVWQWTRSSYAPYPRFRPEGGDLGEYNGKFMSGQYVLRGSSCATTPGHSRITYRNFFAPDAAWQFSGMRLARDV